jgi:hypothetical protein
MPAQLPVSGVIRFAFRGTAGGQGVVNVFHLNYGIGPISLTNLQAVCSTVRTAYETHLVPRLQGAWSGDTCTATDLSGPLGETVVQALGGTPGAVSPQAPLSLACCITWKIARHYRGGHPRTYLGPIAIANVESGNTWTSAFLTSVIASAASFRTAVNAATVGGSPCQMVAVHRVQNGALLNPPLQSPVTSSVVDGRIDTMRRRLGRDR